MQETVQDGAPQHMRALNEANRVRLSRARLKREIAAGRLSMEEALEHPDLARMPLLELLTAQPRWGRRRALKVLGRTHSRHTVPLGENKPVGELTERQKRTLLLAMLPAHEREAALDAAWDGLPAT